MEKRDENKPKEKKLSEATILKVTELAARTAVEAYKKELEAEKARFKDKRFNNAKLLLRKYKWLIDYSANAIYESTQLQDGMEEILEAMGAETSEVRKVQSIQKNVVITSMIMEHIQAMLDCYHRKCEDSGKPEEKRKWRTIYNMFIAEPALTAQEIADMEHKSLRTVYADVDAACEDLSTLFFGLDLTIL